MPIVSPRISVTRDENGESYIIQTTNIDLVGWDRTRAKHRWPKTEEAPFLWMTFLAWSASRREGRISRDVTYEQFEAGTYAVQPVNADGEPVEDSDEADPVDPTRSIPALD